MSLSRPYQYWATAIGLSLVSILLQGTSWQGSTHLHTVMEVAATLLAGMVGVIALIRYKSIPGLTILFIGASFTGAAILDGYHSAVTATGLADLLPSMPDSLIPRSWVASRLYLATMLTLGWWLSTKAVAPETHWLGNEKVLLQGSAVILLASLLFFAFVPLPAAYYPELYFHRPEEFIPGALFAVALYGFLRKGQWRVNEVEHWLILSLIVGLVGQVAFMPLSTQLFDMNFNAAHLIKNLSYLCVLIGLLINMHRIFYEREQFNKELIKSTEALKIESLFSQKVIEQAPNAIVMIDSNGLIELVNEQTEKIFGYARAELLGQSIETLLPERYRALHPQHRGGFFSSPSPRAMGHGRDLFARRKDGSEFSVEIGLNPISTSAGTKVLSSILDISERKNNEKKQIEFTANLAQINSELNNFTYIASHDLKSPLRGIDQLATWITEDLGDSLTSETKEHLNLMRSRINRMEMLLDDLLAYSRVGRSDDDIVQVNIPELLNDIFDLTATKKKIKLILSDDLPIFNTKKVPLELVFRNLISNAIKHHDKAQGTITISVQSTKEWLEFQVQDDGPGIPLQHQERVFSMFQTLRPRDEIEGSGIGLALVKKTVETVGGSVTLESNGIQGCTFKFTWPATIT